MASVQNLTAVIDSLKEFPDRLDTFFQAFAPERRHWKPASWEGIPSERLTAIEQLCHLRDVEIEGYHARFSRTLAEQAPVLPDLPGERMADERRYAAEDPAAALQAFRRARAATLEIVRGFSPGQLSRIAIFEGRPTSLAGLVHFLCSHDYQHLSGLQWLLAKIEQTA